MRKTPPSPPPSLEKRPQPGRLRAVFLAVLVHGLFFALIVFGVTWQSRPTAPLQAELWDKLPPAKAKAPPPPPEPPKTEPKPEPPKPEPPKPEPPKPEAKPQPPKPDPAIAEKAERLKKEKEKRERLEHEKLEKARKEEQARKKHEQEEAAKKKEEEERARQERERQITEQRARVEAAQARQREIDGWVQKITAKIRSRANIPDTVTGSPEPHFQIRVLPGGEVLDITLTKPSGNPAYDAAIERAIRSASPLPVPPPNSELFPQFRVLNLEFRHER